MILQKLTAVNKEQSIPIISVIEKPFIKLPPNPNNAIAAMIVVKFESMIVDKAFEKPL